MHIPTVLFRHCGSACCTGDAVETQPSLHKTVSLRIPL